MSLYLNGTAVATHSSFSQGSSQIGTLAPFRIGAIVATAGTPERLLRGAIDEARVSSVTRSADWAKLDYETQRPSGNVTVVIGSPTNVLPSGKTMIQSAPVSARVAGSNVIFTVAEKSAGKLLVLDMQGRTVWSHDVSADSREIAWNSAGKGVFFARFSPKDAKLAYLDTKFSLIK
jgi:hypothetical protein